MIRLLYLCCFFLIALPQTTVASSPLIILDDSENIISLTRYISTYKAEENSLSAQQISSPPYSDQFKLNMIDATKYGYHSKDFWIQFAVQSTSQADWYLMLDHLILDKVDIFILPKDKNITDTKSNTPLFIPIKQHRTPTWKLKLPENKEFAVYLRIFNPKDALLLSAKLMQESDFVKYTNTRHLFLSMILAGMMTLAVYNLFLALSLQDKSYIILAIFIILFSALGYRSSNLFPALYKPLISPQNWYHIPLVSLTQAVAAYYWYTIHRNADFWLEKFGKWYTALSFLATALIIIFPVNGGTVLYFLLPGLIIFPILMLRAIIFGKTNILSSFLPMLLLFASISIYLPLYLGGPPDYPLESHDIGKAGCLLAFLLLSLNHAGHTRNILKQAERAETSNKATHNFLTTMSHELRTPMHTVLGANQLLRTTPLNQAQKNYLNSAELASRQMLSLVDDVLVTARLHNSQPVLIENHPFNLARLLDDIEKMYSIQARQKRLTFSVDVKSLPLTTIIGDEKHLNQILTNLIGNAIKYTHRGKVMLTVSTEAKLNNDKPEKNYIHFAVQDTGPGIPTQHHALLFQPFYQTDSSRSRHKDGAGLGLAISHKLVKQMGGELQLRSTLGKGSYFFFTLDLPICSGQAPMQDANKIQSLRQTNTPLKNRPISTAELDKPTPITTESNKNPLSGLKVLLVDDGELNLMIGEQLLTLQGADVTLAESGKDALIALTKVPFDLVLMDVSMPDMDGYQTTRSIRQNSKFRTLPIIALTAHAIDGEKERCLESGMNDYLSKPFQMEHLLELAAHYCAKEHFPG